MFADRASFLRFGIATSVGVAALRTPAGAAEFTYRYAMDANITHPMGQAVLWWASQVLHESGGQMEIQVFPSGQLGSGPRAVTQLREGAIQFFHYSGPTLGDLVPVAGITGVAFAFPHYEDVFRAIDGDLGALIRSEITAKSGLYVFQRGSTTTDIARSPTTAVPSTRPPISKG